VSNSSSINTTPVTARLCEAQDASTGRNDEVNAAVANCSIPCYSGRMARTIPQRDLRNENAKVIDAVTAGETFVVTRNGEPVAELRPIRAGRPTFITRDEVANLASAAVRIDHRRFRADLDKLIDQGL
jgi:prevent-host-death family protein